MWRQYEIQLPPFARGFHLITRQILEQTPELPEFSIGLAHFFLHHTSAALTLNENADPSVRRDFESHFSILAPENAAHYQHTLEGPDDMPAHLKSSLLGATLSIPISRGRLKLGTWQGIYLCEHRDHAAGRHLTVTLHGEA